MRYGCSNMDDDLLTLVTLMTLIMLLLLMLILIMLFLLGEPTCSPPTTSPTPPTTPSSSWLSPAFLIIILGVTKGHSKKLVGPPFKSVVFPRGFAL